MGGVAAEGERSEAEMVSQERDHTPAEATMYVGSLKSDV